MKHLLLLTFAILGVAPAWAQLADLKDAYGNLVNGGLIVHWGDHETNDQSVNVVVNLNGSVSKDVNVRRYELEVEPNTENYFCWGVCYGAVAAGQAPVWYSLNQHYLPLEPGVDASNFYAYHSPLGELGTSTYRFVWFDVMDPMDTVWVDIQFQTTGVGINERTTDTNLNVYPNPATGSEVTVAFDGTADLRDGIIAFRNMVGQVVLTQRILTSQGRVVLSIADLPAGVYFATIEQQERILATQRVVISH